MAISEKAKMITELIYRVYGTDSGYLFGISTIYRTTVEAIVQITLDMEKEVKE